MTVWFTSDLHAGHLRAPELCDRPFDNIDAMDDATIDRINQSVAPDDILWVLGDVALGDRSKSLPKLARVNGRKRLVAGHHDHCWGGHAKPKHHDRFLAVGFELVADQAWTTIAGTPVLLSHLPYEGDSHEGDRYADQRPVDRGTWLLCGHVHNAWRQRDRQINVGVDAWGGQPISGPTIATLIEQGPADRAAVAMSAAA